jgi:hypothetical protein
MGASDTYLRVPLNAFVDGCNIRVGISGYNQTSNYYLTEYIILGGMFFNEFQGVFTNGYYPISTN